MKVSAMPLVAYIGFFRKGFVCGVKKSLHMTTHTGADRQGHVDTQCLGLSKINMQSSATWRPALSTRPVKWISTLAWLHSLEVDDTQALMVFGVQLLQ
jgi:hypothetical protein